jgi:metacaspase-1
VRLNAFASIFAMGALLLSFSLEACSSNLQETSSRRALLVGISKYSRGRTAAEDWQDLRTGRDIMMLRRVLVEKFDFKKEDIHELTDEKATLEAITQEFRAHLISPARPGDIIFFHFSGHGQQVKDIHGDELDGLDECFVPYDYRIQGVKDMTNNPRLIDDDLGALIADLMGKMKGSDGKMKGDIVVSIDSCHSGTGVRGLARCRGRDWDEDLDGPLPQRMNDRGLGQGRDGNIERNAAQAGYVFFGACRDTQTAKEDPDLSMGVFSSMLVKALEQARPGTTYQGLYENICSMMRSSGWDQEPQVEGASQKLLFQGKAKAEQPYILVEPGEDAGTVVIAAGALHGMTPGSRFAIYGAGSDVSCKDNIMAEAQVTEVSLDRSKAKAIVRTGTSDASMFSAARAVEHEHNFESSLKVYSALEGPWKESLSRLKIVSSGSQHEKSYDVKISMDSDKNMVKLERKDGSLICEISSAAPSIADEVHDALLSEWRKRFMAGLICNDISIGMRIARVSVKTSMEDRQKIVEVLGEPSPLSPGNNGSLDLKEGSWVAFQVRNNSAVPAYITILDIDPAGRLIPFYPNPDRIDYNDIIQGKGNVIPADGKWYSLPPGMEPAFQKQYFCRITPPYGREHLKLIATSDPVDLSLFVHRRTVAERGEQMLRDVQMRGDRERLFPLSLLIYDTNDGGMRAVRVGTRLASWGTADLYFNVVRQ